MVAQAQARILAVVQVETLAAVAPVAQISKTKERDEAGRRGEIPIGGNLSEKYLNN